MNIWEAARIALRGLRSNRMRSVLTMLGIIIGVSSVILLVAFGNGLQTFINDAFGPLANQLTVSKSQGSLSGNGAAEGAHRQRRRRAQQQEQGARHPVGHSGASAAARTSSCPAARRCADRSSDPRADYFTVTDRDVVVGEFFDEQQVRNKSKVVVLGPNIVAEPLRRRRRRPRWARRCGSAAPRSG